MINNRETLCIRLSNLPLHRFLSLLPCEKQLERRSSCCSLSQTATRQDGNSIDLRRQTLASPIPSLSSRNNSFSQPGTDAVSVSSSNEFVAFDDDDSYFLEATERWNFSQLTHTFWDDSSIAFEDFKSSATSSIGEQPEYEGSFLAALFDAASKICETGVAKSLVLTKLLGNVAILADQRADWIVCSWGEIPRNNDALNYTQYENCDADQQQPARRTIHGVVEKVTLDALKRARTIPKFEARLRVAKDKGRTSSELLQIGPDAARPDTSIYKQLTRRTSITQLLFSSIHSPPMSPTPSEPTTPSSPTSAFFQYPPPRSNWTPITLTNPFAKLPEFLTGYIILQEFCKEMAATVMVKYVSPSELEPLDNGETTQFSSNVHPLEAL